MTIAATLAWLRESVVRCCPAGFQDISCAVAGQTDPASLIPKCQPDVARILLDPLFGTAGDLAIAHFCGNIRRHNTKESTEIVRIDNGTTLGQLDFHIA